VSLLHRGRKQVITCGHCKNKVVATLRMTGSIRCTRCKDTLPVARKALPIKEATRGR
jgi:ribosomal protein S27E